MAPTYIFLVTLLTVMGIGLVKTLVQRGQPWPVVAPPAPVLGATTVSTWLLLRAFANGCTAMTGVEAVSNGIPIFREPRTVGARRTLSLIIGLLAALLVGESILCRSYG